MSSADSEHVDGDSVDSGERADATDADGAITSAAVRDRLRAVIDPCSAAVGTDLDVVEMGMVDGLTIDGGEVSVRLSLTTPGCMMVEFFQREVEAQVGALDGVESVELETDAGFTWTRSMMSDAAREKRAGRRRDLAERYADVESENGTTDGD
jgi:metal-sulfur cluster biosynthetic enzyme